MATVTMVTVTKDTVFKVTVTMVTVTMVTDTLFTAHSSVVVCRYICLFCFKYKAGQTKLYCLVEGLSTNNL